VGRVSMAMMPKMLIVVIRRSNGSSWRVRRRNGGEIFLVAMIDQKRDGES
jgi:hypothetical protein